MKKRNEKVFRLITYRLVNSGASRRLPRRLGNSREKTSRMLTSLFDSLSVGSLFVSKSGNVNLNERANIGQVGLGRSCPMGRTTDDYPAQKSSMGKQTFEETISSTRTKSSVKIPRFTLCP
jgi:hypothetical protein